MDQTHSNALGINNLAQPQGRFAPLNAGLQSTAYTARRFHWVVAIQNFDGSSYLLSIPLYDWDTVEQAFARAREQLSKVSSRKYHERCMSMLVMKTVVGTARVNRIMTCDLDPLIRYRVSIQDPEHDALLSEIFHKSTQPTSNARTFPFSSAGIDDYQGQRIIVIRRVLDKFKIARLLILLLLISPALGTLVGTLTHRGGVEVPVSAGIGVTVSAAVFALASFLQALATWLETGLRILDVDSVGIGSVSFEFVG
ncbi:hypothetical protein MMC22_010808 [Lobaria immixta]|nr:hypothetical protein [Lobaria immixta]